MGNSPTGSEKLNHNSSPQIGDQQEFNFLVECCPRLSQKSQYGLWTGARAGRESIKEVVVVARQEEGEVKKWSGRIVCGPPQHTPNVRGKECRSKGQDAVLPAAHNILGEGAS